MTALEVKVLIYLAFANFVITFFRFIYWLEQNVREHVLDWKDLC